MMRVQQARFILRLWLALFVVLGLMTLAAADGIQNTSAPSIGQQQGVSFPTGQSPLYSVDLTANNVVPVGISYSATSLRTVTDANGFITYAPNNLLTQSNTFSNAVWTKTNIGSIVQGATDPFGGTTAWTMTDNSSNAVHFIDQGASSANNQIHAIYAKAGTASFASIGQGGSLYAVFDLGAGTVASQTGVIGNITSVGNGWYLISVTYQPPSNSFFEIYMGTTAANTGPNKVYSGTGSTILIADAVQSAVTYETSTRPGDQVITTSSAYYGPAFDSNYPSAGYQGLRIEEQRTNLLEFSSDFTQSFWNKHAVTVTTNSTTAPDGTNTAQLISEAAVIDSHYTDVATGVTVTNGQPYSRTLYEKYDGRQWLAVNIFDTQANLTFFDIQNGVVGNNATGNTASIKSVGNGWYKLSVERTVSATSVFLGVQGAIANGNTSTYLGSAGWYQWGQQLELGSNPTSYIPTGASAVTRSADIVQATGTLATCLNASSKTVANELLYNNPTANSVVFLINTANKQTVFLGTGNALFTSNGTQHAISTGAINPGSIGRYAANFTSTSMAIAVDGTAVGTNSNGSTPGGTNTLGSNSGSNQFIDGPLRKIACWSPALPNSILQQKSVVGPGPITWLIPSNDNFAIDERRRAA